MEFLLKILKYEYFDFSVQTSMLNYKTGDFYIGKDSIKQICVPT